MPTVEARALEDGARWKPGPIGAGAVERRLEQHRAELTTFCRRMLGSRDADDAVQETLVRAWRAFDRFEGRAALRSWLYRIASNVCRDALRARRRRARYTEMMALELTRGIAPARARPTDGAPAPADAVAGDRNNPAESAVAREAVRLALATVMRLPPRQRAVLILRDVLGWRAVEVAELLDTTVAAVNGSLSRARATLAARRRSSTDPSQSQDGTRREVLARYVDAFERYDLAALCSILREEGRRAPSTGGG